MIMSQHTILVVEDNNNQRALYQEELAEEGYQVLTAADGREALAMAREKRPDLVVLDVNMPVMDGLDTLSYLLEIDSGLPVIINTAYASYQDSFNSWSADAYIVKSSDLSELKSTVQRLLAEKAERREKAGSNSNSQDA
jgi:DNA-binding response OmpR family regulator